MPATYQAGSRIQVPLQLFRWLLRLLLASNLRDLGPAEVFHAGPPQYSQNSCSGGVACERINKILFNYQKRALEKVKAAPVNVHSSL